MSSRNNRRSRRTTAAKPAAEAPQHVQNLLQAVAEGNRVAHAALAVHSKVGNKFWVSGGNVLDIGRDPYSGDVLVRVGADTWSPCAGELATLAGMLMAASLVQAGVENPEKETAGV